MVLILLKVFKSPVLLQEVIHGLNIVSDGVYIDGTFGQGGHAKVILSHLNRRGQLLGIDRDLCSVQIGKDIEQTDDRFTMIYGRFSNLFKYMKYYGLVGKVNGILLDLGLSRLQLEDSNRGFSFMKNGPLDMRMDMNCGLSADMWLRQASLEKIFLILKSYGEEKFARRIAKAIVMYRSRGGRLRYTQELVQLIVDSVPWRDKNKHPATRTFQAIRIYINDELEEIKKVLQDALLVLSPGGRLLVISFHSLEDRIVKFFIRRNSISLSSMVNLNFFGQKNECFYDCQKIFIRGKKNHFHEKTYFDQYQYKCYLKCIKRSFPSKEEVKNNVCSRSAVLRCVEKVLI